MLFLSNKQSTTTIKILNASSIDNFYFRFFIPIEKKKEKIMIFLYHLYLKNNYVNSFTIIFVSLVGAPSLDPVSEKSLLFARNQTGKLIDSKQYIYEIRPNNRNFSASSDIGELINVTTTI